MTNPSIRIDCKDGKPYNTHVYDENGVEISQEIQRLEVVIDVENPEAVAEVGAKVYAVMVNGGLMAEVRDIAIKVLPPPPAKTTYRLTIGEPQKNALGEDVGCRYTLIRSTPLPTYGSVDEEIASGGMPVIGPLELVFEEAT